MQTSHFVLQPRSARRQSGFTLIEIMMVVMIMGILLNIAAPSFLHARDSAQARACIANLHNIMAAKEQYGLQNNLQSNSAYVIQRTDVTPYIKGGSGLQCPATNANLTIGTLSGSPACPSYPNGPVGEPYLAHSL